MSIPGDVRSRRLCLFALSAAGVGFTLLLLWQGACQGLFPFPGGDAYDWDRVGDEVRAGISPYGLRTPLTDSFCYAPPWAVAFALSSWLPVTVQAALLIALKIVSLRLIAGSWRGAGLLCWFPLVAFDLAGGNFNLLVAAAIVLAVRDRPGLAVVVGLAKLSPFVAIHPRQWRTTVLAAFALFVITLPWITLWPAWVGQLVSLYGVPIGPQVPLAFPIRALAAVGLLVLWRPWSRALAAVILIPAFYWGSLVLLLAPLAVWLRSPRHSEMRLDGTSRHGVAWPSTVSANARGLVSRRAPTGSSLPEMYD